MTRLYGGHALFRRVPIGFMIVFFLVFNAVFWGARYALRDASGINTLSVVLSFVGEVTLLWVILMAQSILRRLPLQELGRRVWLTGGYHIACGIMAFVAATLGLRPLITHHSGYIVAAVYGFVMTGLFTYFVTISGPVIHSEGSRAQKIAMCLCVGLGLTLLVLNTWLNGAA